MRAITPVRVLLDLADPATLPELLARRPRMAETLLRTTPVLTPELEQATQELWLRLVRRHGVEALAWRSGPADLPALVACAQNLAMVTELVTGHRAFAEKVGESLEAGTVTAVELVDQVAPARCLLGAAAMARPAELAATIGDLVCATVGTDEGAWRALWKLLVDDWPGTLPDLLATAVAGTGNAPTWVRARSAPASGSRKPQWTPHRLALRGLLACCPSKIVLAVLPVLDGLALFDLLGRDEPDPELVRGVVAGGDLAQLRQLARNYDLPPDCFDGLLRLDDPEINGDLYRSRYVSRALRRRIIAGLRHDDPGPGGADRLQLSDRLREHLLSLTERRSLLPIIESGLTELTLEMMRKTRVPTALLQLRLVLAVARREGVPAARALLAADLTRRHYQPEPWMVTTRRAAGKALETSDHDAAVRTLQALVDKAATPDKWVKRLRRVDSTTGGLNILDAEQHTIDWSLLLAEHAREPFDNFEILRYLRGLPGCPPELSAATEADREPTADVGVTDTEPRSAAAAGSTSVDGAGPTSAPKVGSWEDWRLWAPRAVSAGAAPLSEVVTWAAPAADLFRVGSTAGWWQRPDNPLPDLCRDRLGDGTDGWLLAMDLVEDFPGTLPELLDTVRAATVAVPAAGR